MSGPATTLPPKTGYDRWAPSYDAGNPLTALEGPVLKRLLGPVTGLRVLDAGCGTGRHAVDLAARGAEVVGLDFSGGMLGRAIARAEAAGVKAELLAHDLTKPLPFNDACFDRVISCLVLEHIKNLDAFLAELSRVCRPGGFLVVTAMHPAMFLKGSSARFRDPRTGEKILPRSHHAQKLSDYVMAGVRAGLAVDHLEEHEGRGEHAGWPMLAALKLRRH